MDTLEISLKWTNQKELKKEELLRLKKCPEPSGMGSIFNTFLTLPSSLKQWKNICTMRHTEISHQCKHRKFIPISFIHGMEIKSWKQLESKIYIYIYIPSPLEWIMKKFTWILSSKTHQMSHFINWQRENLWIWKLYKLNDTSPLRMYFVMTVCNKILLQKYNYQETLPLTLFLTWKMRESNRKSKDYLFPTPIILADTCCRSKLKQNKTLFW